MNRPPSPARRQALEDEEDELCIRLTQHARGDRTPPGRRSGGTAAAHFNRLAGRAGAKAPGSHQGQKGASREVVLKVLSTASDRGGLSRHVRYITRDGEIEHQREDGAQRAGPVWREFVDQVMREDTSRRKNRGLTVHLLVSVPDDVAPDTLHGITDEWMEAIAPEHRRLIVVHTDTAHAHAHVVVARQGPARRFRLPPQEFQRARSRFASIARTHGLDVTATPRSMTGRLKQGQGRRKWEKAKRRGRRAARTASPTRQEKRRGAAIADDLKRLAEVRSELGDREGAALADGQHKVVRRSLRVDLTVEPDR